MTGAAETRLPIRCQQCRAIHMIRPDRIGVAADCKRCGAPLPTVLPAVAGRLSPGAGGGEDVGTAPGPRDVAGHWRLRKRRRDLLLFLYSLLLFILTAMVLALATGFLGGCATAPAGGDRSPQLYHLPFEAGREFACVQPGPGMFSHMGFQKYAVDFDLPAGTRILAARGGLVVEVKEDSDRGGPSRDFASDGNLVRILHDDRTLATYLHLKQGGALVEVGQRVATGEVIGLSGATGWAAMPHLHFQVDALDVDTREWRSTPIAFVEVPGDGVPRFLARYVSRNRAP